MRLPTRKPWRKGTARGRHSRAGPGGRTERGQQDGVVARWALREAWGRDSAGLMHTEVLLCLSGEL